MTDDELLHLAAKAAGIDAKVLAYDNDGTAGYWNPLDDDGDAFRLIAKLTMHIGMERNVATAWPAGKHWMFMTEKCGDDPAAALRRAVVRVAAAIGKEMS